MLINGINTFTFNVIRYMINRKALSIFSCGTAVFTMLTLVAFFGLRPSLSQYVDVPEAHFVFSVGFFITSLAFLTFKPTYPLFVLLNCIILFDTYHYETIHNISALLFFGYANYLMVRSYPSLIGYCLIPFWILVPLNSILLFEFVGVTLLSLHFLYIHLIILKNKR